MKALLKTLALVVGIPLVYAMGIVITFNSTLDPGWQTFSIAWPLPATVVGMAGFLIFIGVRTLFIHFDRQENPDLYYYSGGRYRRNNKRRKVWWMT